MFFFSGHLRRVLLTVCRTFQESPSYSTTFQDSVYIYIQLQREGKQNKPLYNWHPPLAREDCTGREFWIPSRLEISDARNRHTWITKTGRTIYRTCNGSKILLGTVKNDDVKNILLYVYNWALWQERPLLMALWQERPLLMALWHKRPLLMALWQERPLLMALWHKRPLLMALWQEKTSLNGLVTGEDLS